MDPPAGQPPVLTTRTAPRGAAVRKAILDAAIDSYSKNGPKRAKLSDIAREVGISSPTILYHFGTKAGLITAMVEELEKRRIGDMESMAEQGGIAMLRDLAAYAHQTEGTPSLAALALRCSVENLGPADPAHEYFLKQGDRDRAIFRKGLRVGIARGEFRKDIDIDVTIEEIRAFMAGAWLLWLLDPDHVSLSGLYEGYFTRLIRDLSP